LRTIGQHKQICTVYDNINIQDRVRHEDVGHRAGRIDATNASVYLCDDIPLDGLRQDMHNPSIPLTLEDVTWSVGLEGDASELAIAQSHIADAVKRIHQEAVNAVFKNDPDRYPLFPLSEDCLSSTRTQYWQFAAVFENEGTIEGTYGVHKDLFQEQLGLAAPEDPASDERDDFRDRLYLAHGDQLTAHHIRSLQSEQVRASRPYDKRNWLLGIPAWFHVHYRPDPLGVRCPARWSPSHYTARRHHVGPQSDVPQ